MPAVSDARAAAAGAGRPVRERLERAGALALCATVALWSAAVALTQPVWSPIDEGSHWLAASSIASATYPRGGVPTGRMPEGLPPWPASAIVEVVQPPVNYLLLGAIDKGVRGVRTALRVVAHVGTPGVASVYAMRLSNALLFGLLALILWLAAREVAPGSLLMAWGMPATLLVFHGPIIDATRAGNDVLVAVLTALAIYLALRWRRRLTVRRGLVVGLVAALAVLSKYTGVFALLPVGLLALARLRASPRPALAYLTAVAGAWLLPVAAWAAWARTQPALGADAMVRGNPPELIFHHTIGELVPWIPLNFRNFLVGQLVPPDAAQAPLFLGLLAGTALLLVVGAVVAWRRPGVCALSRGESLALLVSGPGFVPVLFVMTWGSGIVLVGPGRYDLPCLLPLAFGELLWLLAVPRFASGPERRPET